MGIREDFEKSFRAEKARLTDYMTLEDSALWAAQWMANKIADFVEQDGIAGGDDGYSFLLDDKIRQLSKELYDHTK